MWVFAVFDSVALVSGKKWHDPASNVAKQSTDWCNPESPFAEELNDFQQAHDERPFRRKNQQQNEARKPANPCDNSDVDQLWGKIPHFLVGEARVLVDTFQTSSVKDVSH